jgi:hypothetical protein
MAVRRIRYLVLAALGVFAALPVAKVYTVGAPWVEKMEIRTNDLVGLQGKGVPGTNILVYYKQRNFIQGCSWDSSAAPDDTASCHIPAPKPLKGAAWRFTWCDWLANGTALYLGSAVVNGAGTWQLQWPGTQVLPGAVTGRTCSTGVLTEIFLYSQYGDVSAPEMQYLQVDERGGSVMQLDLTHRRVGGRIVGANQVAAGVADGPNDVQDATAPWTLDTDEDGTDLCESGLGCGAPVWWKLGGGGTFEPSRIEVRDDSPLVGPRDQEFGHVMGMIQGHKPGGSVLAAAYVARPAPLGPTINVNLDMNGASVSGAGCDASGGYFDFFL